MLSVRTRAVVGDIAPATWNEPARFAFVSAVSPPLQASLHLSND